jgi:uncharacterized protein YceK
MKIRCFLLLVATFTLTGCKTTMMLVDHGLASPYEATKHNAEVAWDVGAMRYEKYTYECPAFIGWLALVDLPFTAVADTALLPFLMLYRIEIPDKDDWPLPRKVRQVSSALSLSRTDPPMLR